MANVSSKPSLVRPRAPPPPALLISTCSGSPRARNSSAQARTEARSARSSGRNTTAPFPASAEMRATAARPFSAERQATNTLPPRLARPVAVARPIPVLAPVTRKVRPDSSAGFACMPDVVPPAGGLAAPGRRAGQPLADPAARRSARRRRMWLTLSLVAVLLIGVNTYTTYVLVSQRNATAGAGPRPSGIPGNISTSTANLMQLSPVPAIPAPGFRLTDQHGHTLTLASLRGKVVVLEFMDPHCTDICPIVSQEYIDAYHRLGAQASKVVFAAINVNQYHARVQDMAAYSDAHR